LATDYIDYADFLTLRREGTKDKLSKTGNNRQLAAKLLGIGERTLYRKIKAYNL
jgi:transcriptional regulator with PAS, ATPase and Fis domain